MVEQPPVDVSLALSVKKIQIANQGIVSSLRARKQTPQSSVGVAHKMVLKHALMRVGQYAELLGLHAAKETVALSRVTAEQVCIVTRAFVSAALMGL